MSLLKAPPDCSATEPVLAFQPNRPVTVFCAIASQTLFGMPQIAPPAAA